MPAGRKPLPRAVVDETRRLLAEGFSQAEVSRRLGISLGSVSNIAHGRHGAPSPNQAARREPDERHVPDGIRCPTCGGKIEVLPCRLCRGRAATMPAKENPLTRGASADRIERGRW